MTLPDVSIIIPTYNRKESLLLTLEHLGRQTYAPYCSEVIVVDDGSSDGTGEIATHSFPFTLRYVHQKNRGGVEARNRGADIATGEVLVFLDDDMTPHEGYLAHLMDALLHREHLLARGRVLPWSGSASVFVQQRTTQQQNPSAPIGDFSSNNLAIWRQDFWALGGWKDVLPGVQEHRGGIWADLEFACRAVREGYELLTVSDALIVHRDYATKDLRAACRRAYMVSKLAVPVLRNYPHLRQHIPMLTDKGPIVWGYDPPELVLRKVARQAISSSPMVWLLEQAVLPLERYLPRSIPLRLFYRWIISGYIYHGYRDGLQDIVFVKSHHV